MLERTEAEVMAHWNSDSKPLVSICCIAYNQENYIAQALDSFLSQVTSFPFEVIVRDDASTDSTRSIIEEYRNVFPNIVRPILEKTNQYSKGVKPTSVVLRKAAGRYVALCEGDDYWLSTNKLQSQVEVLEEDQSVAMVFSNARVLECDESGQAVAEYLFNTELPSGLVAPQEILRKWIVPTASVVFRNRCLKDFYSKAQDFPVGDTPLFLYQSKFGKLYYQNLPMAAYRRLSSGIYRSRFQDVSVAKSFIAYYEALDRMFPELLLRQIVRDLQAEQYAWQACIHLKNSEFLQSAKSLLSILVRAPTGLPNLFKRLLKGYTETR